jgi:hypothetical protein
VRKSAFDDWTDQTPNPNYSALKGCALILYRADVVLLSVDIRTILASVSALQFRQSGISMLDQFRQNREFVGISLEIIELSADS